MSSSKLWRQDITGLRALAVIPVLLFHAFPEALPGGFFGVDIFFVISGYLISGIIFRGLKDRTFSFAEFYAKRVKRIIPALITVLLFVIALGWAILFKEEFDEIIRYIVGSAFFFMNFRLISRANDYFQTDAESLPLLHIWSLSIEEQFYIFFPLICFCIWKFSRRKEAVLWWFVLAMTAVSFASCLAISDGLYRFYFPTSRFWELGAGILLSYAEVFKSDQRAEVPQNGTLKSILSVAAFFLIVGVMVFYPTDAPTPGWVSLFSVLGAALLIAAGSRALVNRTLLSCKPFVFIGLVSYSLYLWHWPLLVYFKLVFGESTAFWKIGVLLTAFALSVLTYLIVEVPLRRTKVRGTIPVLFVLLVLCVSLPYAVRKGVLPPVWMDINSREMQQEQGRDESFPSMVLAGVEVPVSGTNPSPTVLVSGDSHSGMYFERAAKVARDKGVNAVLLYTGACFVTDGFTSAYGKTEGKCVEVNRKFKALLSSGQIGTLVLGQMWGDYEDFVKDPLSPRRKEFVKTIEDALRDGVRVYVLEDIPWTTKNSSEFDKRVVFRRTVIDSGLIPWTQWRMQPLLVSLPSESNWRDGNEVMRRILPSGARVIGVANKVCPGGKCDLRWYRDDDHLLRGWARDYADWIDEAFDPKDTR